MTLRIEPIEYQRRKRKGLPALQSNGVSVTSHINQFSIRIANVNSSIGNTPNHRSECNATCVVDIKVDKCIAITGTGAECFAGIQAWRRLPLARYQPKVVRGSCPNALLTRAKILGEGDLTRRICDCKKRYRKAELRIDSICHSGLTARSLHIATSHEFQGSWYSDPERV